MKTKKNYYLLSLLPLALTVGCNNQGNNLVGFDIDFAKAVAADMGVDIKFEEIVWEQKEIELNSKNIDLIWNGLTITAERQQAMEITIPYMENKQVVISKDIDAIAVDDQYNVSYEAGSAGDDLFNTDDTFADCTGVAVSSQIDALTEVLSGTSDLAIIDSTMAGYYLNSETSFESLKILPLDVESEFYGIAGRKGEVALINKINETIVKLYNNGKEEEIAENYGLTSYLITPSYTSVITEDDSLDYIMNKGSITIGYTIYAPIAYIE